MNTDNLLYNRITELAERAFSENRFLYTDFLDQSELSMFYNMEREVSYAGVKVSGGTEGCERCIVRFGSPEGAGYDEAFPVVLLRISPVQKKFADSLTHRDFLGSVIGLGIERARLGDIIVKDNEAFFFVEEGVSEYIRENLTKVKHTTVNVSVCESLPENAAAKIQEETIVVSSNRIDAVTAKVFAISRESAVRYISEGKVFVNGRQILSNNKSLSEGDKVSVRGKGKYIFINDGRQTKKGRLSLVIGRYV